MKPADVWKQGTGVTNFQGSDRYDRPLEGSETGSHAVHDLLGPFYAGEARGPPSYESKESFEKGNARP